MPDVSSGVTSNGVILNNGAMMFVHDGGIANNTTVIESGSVYVSSGGIANNTTVLSNGSLSIKGGTANKTFIDSWGSLFVGRNGTANDTTVYIGQMFVQDGGYASKITLFGRDNRDEGDVYISRGGFVDDLTVDYYGDCYVSSGGIVRRASVNTFGNIEILGGTVNGAIVSAGGRLTVSKGGIITGNMILHANAFFFVEKGSVINFDLTRESAGQKALLNDWSLVRGMPEYTITVNCEQSAGVYKLAEIADEFAGAITVQNVLGESLGKLNLGNTIQVDGTDYTLSLDDSTLTLAVKGPDTTAPIVSNIQSSISSLTNQDVILTAEFADDLDLAQSLYKLGDTGEWTTYQGGVTVTENTNVFFKAIDAAGNESEVASCEVTNIDKTPPETPVAAADVTTPTNVDVLVTAEFSEDSVIKQYSLDGKNWGTYPGGILFGTNLTVYFRGIDAAGNISEVAGYTVTNVDRSAPVITLTGDNQTPTNKATLTASVDDGSKLYYSKDDSGWTEYKTPITVWDNASYSFRATDEAGNTGISEIVFANIEKAVVAKPLFFEGDFNGDDCDMFAVKETDGSTVTICADGALWGAGLELDPGWEIAGVGDFGGDGFDDFLRVHASGLVMGDMSSGNGLFNPQVLNFLNEGWDILGVGDFNGNGTDDVLIANPTAASETVGLLGYWESGTTWTLINGYSAEWECVATGDYNGDGKCDMLWRNSFEGEGGGTYNAYCTWIVDNPVDWRMVSVANPAEWNFLCSGDFDGDKMNDIAMINDVGVVGIWGVNDGWLSSWSILSAVTPEWQLAGVADFNGDGTDDIAWANADTGLVGCWQIENKELASWQTIANLG